MHSNQPNIATSSISSLTRQHDCIVFQETLSTLSYAAVIPVTGSSSSTTIGTPTVQTIGGTDFTFNNDIIVVTELQVGTQSFTPTGSFDVLTATFNSPLGAIRTFSANTGNSTNVLTGSLATSFEDLFSVPFRVNSGSDNTFSNLSNIAFTSTAGVEITNAADLSNFAISILERGGNDTLSVRLATGVDALGAPVTFSNVVDLTPSNFGQTGISFTSNLFDNDGSDPDAPFTVVPGGNTLGNQNVSGVIITADSFGGVGVGDEIFGFQITQAGGVDLLASNALLVNTASIPEPSSLLLLGLGVLSFCRRTRK